MILALVVGTAASTGLWLRAEASLGAERHARRLLQLSYEGLDRSNRELDRSNRELDRSNREREQARDPRAGRPPRAQERFRLALRAVQDTIEGPGETSILRLTDAHGSRQGVLLRIIDLYKKLQASLEGDPTIEARTQLAASYARLGWLTAEVGSADVARAALDKSIEIRHDLSAREPDNPWRLLEEAIALVERGNIERRFLRNEPAMRTYQEAHALLDSLAHRHPEIDRFQTQLSWCLGNLGATQLVAGQPDEALRTHLRVLEIREGLVRRAPGNTTYRADRAWSRLDIAMCLRALDRLPEAVAALEHGWREIEEVHRERPGDAHFTNWLVEFLNPLADALQAHREYSRMLSASEEACRLAEELARAHPEVPRYTHALADNLRNHSSRLTAANLPGHAALDRSASLYEELVRTYPGVNKYRVDLINVRLQQSLLARARSDHAAADEMARRAVQPVHSTDPGTGRRRVADVRRQHLSQPGPDRPRRPPPRRGRARALQTAESLIRRIKTGDSVPRYNLACALAQLSASAGWTAHRAALTERAMDALHLAVKSGFRDHAFISSDPDLIPLRHRPEYQLLLLDLAFPADPFSK